MGPGSPSPAEVRTDKGGRASVVPVVGRGDHLRCGVGARPARVRYTAGPQPWGAGVAPQVSSTAQRVVKPLCADMGLAAPLPRCLFLLLLVSIC